MIDLKKRLKTEDLTDIQRKVAEIIGIESYLKLAESAGGDYIYIPKEESLELYVIKRLVKSEYENGSGISEIARRYQLDKRTVRNYISG